MPLIIKDAETERLARRLARQTGETITIATRRALGDRLRRLEGGAYVAALEDLAACRRRWSSLRVLDSRSEDDIIGYDGDGVPR